MITPITTPQQHPKWDARLEAEALQDVRQELSERLAAKAPRPAATVRRPREFSEAA